MAAEARLNILLVDAVGSRADELEALLLQSGYGDVHKVQGGPALAEEVMRLNPDVVIVDMGLAERDVLESLRDTTARSPRPIILRTDVDDPAFIEEAISAGVSSYHAGSVDPATIRAIMTAAIALFRRHRRSEVEMQAAVASLQERRIVEQAKAALIRRRGMSEPEAYRWLRRKAMRESRKLAVVAAELLRGEET
jgi:two-component system, response regulator / RNA-binding antiterminator